MKKTLNTITVILFALIIFGFSAAFIITPDSDFSEDENRVLQTLPKFSFAALANGEYSSDMTDYFADQFPARDFFVGVKGIAENVLGRSENNGVLLGDDGQLAVRLFTAYKSRFERVEEIDYFYEENITISLDAVNAFAEKSELPLVTVLPPRTIDVAASAFDYPTDISDSLGALIASGLSDKAGYIDLFPIMRERYDSGEYVYMRTDHHWTSLGAYVTYCEIMKSFGMEDEIIPMERFSRETVENFYGTTWSKAGYKFVPPDDIEIWSLGNEDDFITRCYASKMVKGEDGKPVKVKESYKEFSGWMNREYLDKKDKYAAFLDGTHNEQTVTLKSGEERETLLISKDSFANTLVPFLSQHFDLVILNLANKQADLSLAAEEYGCDKVLIVYNCGNLIENNNLALIK